MIEISQDYLLNAMRSREWFCLAKKNMNALVRLKKTSFLIKNKLISFT